MSGQPLPAHSLAEAYLYIMAIRCSVCGRGPLAGADATVLARDERSTTVSIEVTCASCGAAETLRFAFPGAATGPDPERAAVVNPTMEPSRLLDVGQWIMLFRVITEAAAREGDKMTARHLGLEAAQCLEEALKFYEEDNDLPPAEAFFCASSKERFREAPQQFSRRRLVELRAKLPSSAVMRANLMPPRKRWWRRGGI